MLIPDFSFNPSAGARNDNAGHNAGNFAPHTGQFGARPNAQAGDLQLNLKELRIANPKNSDSSTEKYLVTLSIDNQSLDPIRLRIVALGKVQHQHITLPNEGLLVYRQALKGMPTFLDYRILIIEAQQGLPDLPALYRRILQTPKYISVRDILVNVAQLAAPSSSLIGIVADIIINLTAYTINPCESAKLLYVKGSFDRKVDDMGTRYGLIAHANEFASMKYQVERKL